MQAVTGLQDYVARACFKKPQIDLAAKVELDQNGKPVVFRRRWYILLAYAFTYFFWNFSSSRQTAVISEYALYFDTTNEFSKPPEWGIDFFSISSSAVLICTYPIAGHWIDKYGLVMMKVAAVGMVISSWWWFFSFDNYNSVLISRLVLSFFGCLNSPALLRITHNWFPTSERPMAVAIAALLSTLGGGVVLVVSPMFATGEDLIDFNLKSCKDSFKNEFNLTGDATNECTDEASDAFCCVRDMNIDALNFFVSVLVTITGVFTFVVTQDAPPSPPSKAGIVKEGPGFYKAMQLMFSHQNYTFLCIADFLCSGPPLVVFSTIDRILPGNVQDLATTGVALALVVAMPASFFFARMLARTRKFYEMTSVGYVTGFVCFFLAAIVLLIDQDSINILTLVFGCTAVISYLLWTVSVYELKMEYVFSQTYALQGYIVAIDRTVVNLSSIVFLAAIPPERFEGERVDGRQFTFLVGSLAMFIGVNFVLCIRDKFKYLRKEYEEVHGSVVELEDQIEILPQLEDEEKKSIVEKKEEESYKSV